MILFIMIIKLIDGGTNPCGIVKNEEGKTPLHIAAGKGHLEILLLLLYKVGCISYSVCRFD